MHILQMPIEAVKEQLDYEIERYKHKININVASTDELITLYGIGEKRAQAIIDYRKNKKIESFSELKELLGVSDEVIINIKDKAVL